MTTLNAYRSDTARFAGSPLMAHAAALSRAEIEAVQQKKLRAQLERLYAAGGYYRTRMDAAGLKPENVTSLEAFRERFPTSDKADFLTDQKTKPPFGERLSVPRESVALVNLTGGTSGQGQEFYGRTNRDVHMLGYLHALPWTLAGLRPGDVAINCVPAGGMTTGGWGPGEGLRIIGATGFHVGGWMATDAKIDLMMGLEGLAFIYASTNYLHTLTTALKRREIDPKKAFPGMRALFIAAEGYPLEWAERVQETWGCVLHEGYGSTQCNGFAGSTCDGGVIGANGGRGLMRLFEWETMVEIVDPHTMEPTPSGEVGEIVVTNLSVEGSPVIRFRTGDAARFIRWDHAGGPAWNALESGTIGRFDDMMKIRGNNVWPSAVDAVIFAHEEVETYVGRVFTHNAQTEVEIAVAFTQGAAQQPAENRARLLETLRAAIKMRTNVLMTVVEAETGTLQEFSYKARRWKDERQEGYKL